MNNVQSVLWDFKEEKIASLPREFVVRRVLIYGTVKLIIQTMQTDGVLYVQNIFNSLKQTSMPQKKYMYLKNFLLR